MDRNREARRVPMAAAGNGLSRRRHRAGSFRDSPEEDGPVELPEAARLRDRGGSAKKERDRERDRDRERERERDNRERDRLNSRSKRRRGERLMMVHGNLDDGGDDSSEESVNDDEEYDDGGGGVGPPSSLKMLPPSSNISAASFSSSLSNHHNGSGNIHHHHHSHNHQRKNFPPTSKIFRSPPSPAPVSPLVSSWKAADEMIGVSVPRKARSACTKRPHESWASSATGGGVFASGEQIHRQVSTSPARASPASILASPSPPAPTSPSSSSVSVRKKMPSGTKQKPLPPKSSSSCKLSSPVAVQDEIEIEIAEVLYGMMRMPLATSKQESVGNDLAEAGAKATVDVKSRVSSPISNSQTVLQSSITLAANSSSSNISAIAPKRKKPRHVKYDDENSSSLPSRAIKSEAEAPSKSQVPFGDQLKRSGSGEENSSVLDSTNPQPRESNAALDSRSAEKKESNPSKEETVSPKVESSSGFRSDGDGATILGVKPSSPEKEKFEIDLMAPPPVRSSSERGGEMECVGAEAKPKLTEVETEAKPLLKEDGGNATINESEEKKRPRAVAEVEPHKSERNCDLKLDLDKSDHVGVINKHHVQKQTPPQQQQQQLSVPDKTAQATPMPLHMSMPGWPGGLPTMGYMPPTQGVVPTDTSSLSSAAMQPPPHLLFNQPRPKRCATHCYIARNIQSHQQFTKMNPFWPAAAGSAPLYGTKLSLMPSTELQGTVLGRSSNPVPDKNSQSTSKSSDTAQRNQILLQQALPPGAANNMMHGPTFIFPVGQQPHAAATIAAASVRPPNSGNTASSGATATANSMNGSASATPAGAPTMTFSYPGMPGNETQYLAILQNNGYPFPVPAHVGAPPAYRGAPGQPIPFFNGSFYSSQMIQPPFSQPQKQQQQPQQQQAGQMLQSHAPSNQNGSVSTGSSAAQKHLQNQQLRPPTNHGNSQGFPTHKVQSQPLSFQQRQQPRDNATQHSETVGEDSPSTADSRSSRSNVAYGQNYGMQMQPTNLGLMSSASPGGVVVSSSNHGEKKSQQQSSKAGVESFQSQGYAMTFATFNGANSAPSLNMSSIAQNHAMFHSIPEAARQGYQMMAANVAAQAAQQKMNYSAPSDDGKSGSNASANAMEEQRKTGGGATGKTSGVNSGQSIAFSNKHDLGDASVSAVTSGSIVDTSRLLNLGSAMPQSSSSMPTSHHQQQQQQLMQQQQHMQRNQSQQPYTTMYLQKQQRYATSVAASAARTKGSVASNGSGFPDHNITVSPAGTAKYPNANSGFPQNLVQSSNSQVQSPQWKNNSPRATNSTQAQAQSPSILSPSSSAAAASSLRNVSHKQQSRPQQSQISFAANSKPMASGSPMQQMQGGTNNQAPSPPMLVGSPSTSSVSKNASGSPRTTASASSAANKAGQASSITHSSSQPSKSLQSASVASSTGGRNNGPSVLGNPTASSGSKSQQQQQQLPKHGLQQQAQLFFSNPYMQSQHQQQQITISPSGGYYIQRHQQQPGSAATAGATCPPVTLSGCTTGAVTATSDPAKAIAAAAAAANNMKGGGGGMGKTQQHQLVPPGFPYVHAVPSAVQVKPVDQKQQAACAGETKEKDFGVGRKKQTEQTTHKG